MLSQQDIIHYMAILKLPIDTTFFVPALQDELMLLKVSDISNKMIAANIFPDETKLFGAVYIGYDQYITIIQADSFSTVGAALVLGGYAITGDAYTDNLYCYQFIDSIENLISVAQKTIIQNQTAIQVVSELNTMLTNQSYMVPSSLIQQPVAITSNSNVGSNVTTITIDGLQNYFGGNVNVNPEFGGGAFPYTSAVSSTAFYTNIAKSRYLGATLSFDQNGNLGLSRATGIGINVGNIINTQIGDLASTIGTVNMIVGPIDTPQPSQQTIQNSFTTVRQISPSTSMQIQSTTAVNPPTFTPIHGQSSVNTITLPAIPPTLQTTIQNITKTVTHDSWSGQTSNTITYNVVTKGNTIYPDGTTVSSLYSNANISSYGNSIQTSIDIQTIIS
jgi:hypothetical protein